MPEVRYISSSEEMGPWYKAFNNRRNQVHKPYLFASCTSEVGLSQAIRRARRENLKIITLGSLRVAPVTEILDPHQKFMVIHVPNAITTWLDEDRIRCGPFCHTDEVYHQLILRNRILPLGTGPTVKVGGYTLGGGLGILSRSLGLMCDQLQRVTMVDGRGQILDSANEPEILWAARGGAAELFGYFSQFDFLTQRLPLPIVQRAAQVGRSQREELLTWWFAFSQNLPEGVYSSITMGPQGTGARLVAFGVQQDKALEEHLQLHAGQKWDFQVSNLESVTPHDFLSGENLGGNFFEKSSLGFFNDVREVAEALAHGAPILDEFAPLGSRAGLQIKIQVLGGAIDSSQFAERAAFAHRGFGFLAEVNGFWYGASDQEFCLSRLAQVRKLFDHLPAQYRNFQRNDLAAPGFRYYGRNLQRLLEMKKHYDPNGLFASPGGL